jgi:hypothetical protein
MSAISQKSISGITSITSPAGTDDQISLHTSNTNEALKIDGAGNIHIHNHVSTTGISSASNFKTGTSDLHSAGLNVAYADVDDFVDVGSNIKLGNAGVITATSFVGDGSDLTNLPAGLGTALSATATSPLNKMYYTNQVLGVPSSITVDVPASASKAYTQYADIKVESSADLIVAEGDDLIPDVLGLADFGTFGGGASAGRIRVNSISNAANDGSPTVQKGLVVTGVTTSTSFSGSGANLTSLPAGQLTGTVADARISTLTASKLSGALPAISGANLTSLPSQLTLSNNADNRVITGGSGVNLNGESTLTFNGTQLHVNAGAGSNVQVDGTGSYGQFAGVKVWMGLNSLAHNTAVGNGALGSATGGDDCTAIGHNAYQNGTSGTDNTAIGSHCMVGTVTGSRNAGLGHGALNKLTSGYDNTGLGRLAGLEMLGGYQNTYMGSSAGEKTIGANNNTFLGFKAGIDITNSGNQNVAVGSYAFNKQTETSFNVAVGAYSQAYSSGVGAGNNVSVGHEALRGASNASPLTGGRNVAIGRGCMEDCRSGYRNTAIGWESLRNINTGYENVCLGYEAGRTISTGNENILIGASAAPSSTSVSREMFIGNATSGNGANTFYVHSTSGAYNGTNNANWNQTSDQRIKKNITNYDVGLSIINQLQVRNFEYKTKDEIKSANPELTDALQSMENVLDISGVQKGLIAQEAEAVSSAFVTTPSTGVKALVPDEIFWHMLNSIKELSAKNDALEARIQTLETKVAALEGS